jgi:uncharacterized protein (DUF433 family)
MDEGHADKSLGPQSHEAETSPRPTRGASYPHLTFDPDGSARIGDTRYKVKHLAAEHYQHGWTAEELMRQHPDLRAEEVYAALAYFYDNRAALIAEMKAAPSPPPGEQVSRDELLARQSVAHR